MSSLGRSLDSVLSLYSLILIGRLVFEYIRMFARDWRPTGPILMLAEVIYSLTDPLLRLFRRLLPPIRLGSVAFDTGYIAVFFVIWVLRQLVWQL